MPDALEAEVRRLQARLDLLEPVLAAADALFDRERERIADGTEMAKYLDDDCFLTKIGAQDCPMCQGEYGGDVWAALRSAVATAKGGSQGDGSDLKANWPKA